MTLQKKIWRSIGKNLSFYITGTILTALTIMLWVGAFAVSNTMTDTYTDFFAAYNAEDAQFTADREISPEQISQIESKYDLQIEQQMYRNIVFSENTDERIGRDFQDTRIRVLSESEKLNRTCVLSGHEPQTDSDVLINFDYAQAHGVSVGDTVHLCGADFTVAGMCSRPDYAMLYAEFSDSFPETENFGLAVIPKTAMEQLGGYAEYYSISYNRAENEDDARAFLYEHFGMTEYIPRSSNPRMGTVITDAESLKAEFSVYSPIIMLVVVAVIAMVLRRCVKRESKTVGILMALGYNRHEMMRHYMLYALIPAVCGDVLGLIGCVPFAKLFAVYLFSFAAHFEYTVTIPWVILVIALLIPPVVYALTAAAVLSKSLNMDAVSLLKGIRTSRISHMMKSSNLHFKLLYNIRTVLANLSHSVTLLVGIAAATMAVVLSGVYQDAYDDMLENKVPQAMMGGQYEYGFTEFQQENPYGGSAIMDVSFGVQGTDDLFNLVGLDADTELFEPRTVSGKPYVYGGYYMTSSAARMFDVREGDAFTFYNIVSMQDMTIQIDGILENDVLPLIITSKANEAEILGKPADAYNVIISDVPLDIPKQLLQKSASLEDYRTTTENALKTAEIVLMIVKVIGALICILVVMMLAGMIVEENRRNISMLEVLGYRKAEIQSLILSSNHLIVPFGFLVGVPLGMALSSMIAQNNAKSSGILMSVSLTGKTLAVSFVFVVGAYLISLLLAGRKIRNVEMVECLKENRE